jgi:hypothetical protein
VHRHRHHVVGHVGYRVLIEIVPDARAVREQVLDGDVVADQRQIGAEQRPSGRARLEHAAFDQTHDDQRGEALRGAGRRELSVEGGGDAMSAVGEPVRPRHLGSTRAVHPHHPREPRTTGDLVERCLQGAHA